MMMATKTTEFLNLYEMIMMMIVLIFYAVLRFFSLLFLDCMVSLFYSSLEMEPALLAVASTTRLMT